MNEGHPVPMGFPQLAECPLKCARLSFRIGPSMPELECPSFCSGRGGQDTSLFEIDRDKYHTEIGHFDLYPDEIVQNISYPTMDR